MDKIETTYNQVNMRRPIGVAVQKLQQLASRPIEWDRVRGGPQAIKAIFPISIRHKLASQVAVDLVGILLFIKT